MELVLVGSNLEHSWFTHKCTSTEITIQFHKNLFDEKFLRRNQLSFIRVMLEKSMKGILFSQETIQQLAPRIISLNPKNGFDSILELMSILHDLSISRNMRILSNSTFSNSNEQYYYNSRRIEKTMDYVNRNFDKPITLKEVANHCGFNSISNFNRTFKKRRNCTPKEFRESFSGIRIFI